MAYCLPLDCERVKGFDWQGGWKNCELLIHSDYSLCGDSATKLRAFIFMPYYIIARRHGRVFRMALHNEGDWRMETWQRAHQGELSCLHTPIPELCNAILNTCQMPSRFYIIPSNVNKSQTHLLKPFTVRDLMKGHICRRNTLMFALVFYIIPGYEIVRFAWVWSCIHDHTCWSC